MNTYKGYLIRPHKMFPKTYTVAVEGQGGRIPDSLTSLFTSISVAQEHIDKYLAHRSIEKEKVNARKTIAKARS